MAKDGTNVGAPFNPGAGPYASSFTDRNGNELTADSSGHFYDTMSSTTAVLTVAGSGTPSSPTTFTYTAPSGANASYTMKYTTYSLQTNFGCSGITEYGTNGTTTANLVTEIDLPDWNANTNPNSKYTFTYEDTPGHSGFKTGRLTKVTLPTGGYISYTYTAGNLTGSAVGSNDPIACADGSAAGFQRVVNDGTTSNTWIYARSRVNYPTEANHWQTKITTPPDSANSPSVGNDTVIDFQKDSNTTPPTNNFYETKRVSYQGASSSNVVLQTLSTCYNTNTTNCPGTAVSSPITRRTVFPQYGSSGLQCEHNYFYNSVGGLTEQDDYDYGSGPPGALLRQILITYASLGNITAFRQTVTVKDGSGNVKAQYNNNYDETSPIATSGIAQHTSVSGSRGNLTSINYPVSGLTSHLTYYDTGSPNTSQDVNGATTTYNYSSNTADCQMAFPTSISEPLSMSESFVWNCSGGVMTSLTDENSQVTSLTYSDPYFWRPASETFPDTGQTSWAYNSQTSLTTTTKMNSSQNVVSTVLLDGLGRTSQTQLNDPEGNDYAAITYDALGRPYKAYNPTRCSPPTTNCGTESTWGYTTTAYDALGRPTSITLQDGSVVSASYSNNTVTTTDPASKKRQTNFDALGRLTQVTEDPGGLGYFTTYGHDALGNLLNVTQNGSHQRTYAYDAMSRLTSESNPETGTISYGYDASGHTGDLTSRVAPAPNQTGSTTVTTTYSWDLLHRLTQKSYSDGTTPTATYSYDSASVDGLTIGNPVGRLIKAATAGANPASSYNSYDAMGRIKDQWQCTPINCGVGTWDLNYVYDLAGNTTRYTAGVFPAYSQAFDTAGRLTSLTSSYVDSQHPATLATVDSALGYYPHGAMRKMTTGNSLTQTAAFNNALQPCRINVNSSGTALGACADSIPSGNVQDFNYGFNSGSADNGNVASWTATGQQAFNRSLTYDSLNRLSALNQSSGSATGCSAIFNLSWVYDAWGNRTDQKVNSGTCSGFHATVNTQNQLVDPVNNLYKYDAAGDMINDGNHTYFYDAENRLVQVDGTFGTCPATACYVYDALGRRVQKTKPGSNPTNYLYDLNGNPVSEVAIAPGTWNPSNPSIGWHASYIYAGSQLLARYGGSTTFFAHPDHLGSARLLTGIEQSQISNGGFEQGLQGWTTWDNTVQVVTDSAGAHSGSNYVRISTTTGAGFGITTPYISVSPGQVITFGGWAYRESGTTGVARWKIATYDSNLNPITYPSPSPSDVSAAAWTFQQGTYVIPSGTAFVRLYAEIYQPTAATVARFDDGFLYNNGAPVVIAQNLDYLPFGELNSSDSGTSTHKFTSDERDSETTLDHTWFRQYSSQLGRWMHPDPAGLAAANPANPQSWNRYTYVRNNALNHIDPLGLREDMPGQCPHVSIDGVSVDDSWDGGCAVGGWFVRAILSMDAGAICPDGNCNLVRQGSDGQLYEVTAEIELSASLTRLSNADPGDCDPSAPDGCYTVTYLSWHDWIGAPVYNTNDSQPPILDPVAFSNSTLRVYRDPYTYKSIARDIATQATGLACGKSPEDRIVRAAKFGAVRGVVRGAAVGFAGGEFMGGIGGIPGAALGAFMGGTFGAAGGIASGTMVAVGCDLGGAYGQ